MYRIEAQGVPNLLKASVPETQPTSNVANGEELEDGEYGVEEEIEGPYGEQYHYEDGNYWRVASTTNYNGAGQDSDELLYDDYEAPEEEDIDPQEAYYESLMTRFTAFRTILDSPPTDLPLAIASQSLPGYNSTYAEWMNAILNSSPSVFAISKMEPPHILQAIARAEDLLSKKHLLDGQRGRNLGTWCWGLLGRCKAEGEMMSEEVGVVRGLARRAVGILRNWRGREAERERVNVGVNGMLRLAEDGVEEKDVDEEEGQESTEDGEVSEQGDEEGEEAHDVDGYPEPHSLSTSHGDPMPYDGAPSSQSEAHVPEEDVASLELARQKLLEQLSLGGSSLQNEAAEPSTTVPPNPSRTHAQTDTENEEADEGEILSEDGAENDNEEHKPGDRQESHRSAPDPQIAALATLDMIITIVGEFWGQKDLLVHREIWGERG